MTITREGNFSTLTEKAGRLSHSVFCYITTATTHLFISRLDVIITNFLFMPHALFSRRSSFTLAEGLRALIASSRCKGSQVHRWPRASKACRTCRQRAAKKEHGPRLMMEWLGAALDDATSATLIPNLTRSAPS